jgi:hypothetical protein
MLNSRLSALLETWIIEGSSQQEAFDTSRMRLKWIEKFPNQEDFLSNLPLSIDRTLLREYCLSTSPFNSFEKFLAVMVWGYGDRGYGPHRTKIIIENIKFEKVISETIKLANTSNPIGSYDYLSSEKLHGLGPSYGTKLISFCTPREISAPILDSYIITWINKWAKNPLLKNRKIPKSWDKNFYFDYAVWIEAHAQKYACYPDDVELVLFRDAELMVSNSSSWGGK